MSQAKEPSRTQIEVALSVEDLISAIRKLSDEEREFLIENILAATSPEYLESIREARQDYKAGRVVPFDEAFKV